MVDLVDMHMHAGFVPDAAAFAAELDGSALMAFSNTVTPGEYLRVAGLFESCERLRVGLGLHPWWLDELTANEADAMLESFLALLARTRFVGEIGLDFSTRHVHARDLQLRCFESIVEACARCSGMLLSIHSVKAEDALLDVLERHRACAGSAVVLHSFGGSSEALGRAVDCGCRFSIGSRMLATKRGREYARVLPADRILLESDLPAHAGEALGVEELEDDLRATARELAQLRGMDERELLESTTRRGVTLLGCRG